MLNDARKTLFVAFLVMLPIALAACSGGDTPDAPEETASPTFAPVNTAADLTAAEGPNEVAVVACPWDASALHGMWWGDGGVIVFRAGDRYHYSPYGRSGSEGDWACVDESGVNVLLTDDRMGRQQRVLVDLGNNMLTIDEANPAVPDQDFFKDGVSVVEGATFECPWDESQLIGLWEGDRTVLPSGEPLGGSMQFDESGELVCTTNSGHSYTGTWACANSPTTEIIVTTVNGGLVKREITFVGDQQITVERFEDPGRYRDYFRVQY